MWRGGPGLASVQKEQRRPAGLGAADVEESQARVSWGTRSGCLLGQSLARGLLGALAAPLELRYRHSRSLSGEAVAGSFH